jgi:hypothetical protein
MPVLKGDLIRINKRGFTSRIAITFMRGDSDQSVGPIPECILQSDP